MKENRDEFLQAILDAKRILETFWLRFPASSVGLIPSRLDLLKQLIFSEISEILTILFLTWKNMNDLYLIKEKMLELQRQLPSGTVDDKTPSGKEFISVANQQMEITSELTIHIKTIYEWFYHLKELIESHDKIRSLVPDRLWRILQSHCEFRNKLITHKKGIQTYLMSGIRFSGSVDKVELLMMPFSPPESAVNKLDKLFFQCSKNLKTEEVNEKNFYERCRILYRNLDKFTGDQRAKIVAFIQKYGTISANPPEIAEYMNNLTKELIPKLVELEN